MTRQSKSLKTGKKGFFNAISDIHTLNKAFFFSSLKIITEKNTDVWDELREEMHGVASLIC